MVSIAQAQHSCRVGVAGCINNCSGVPWRLHTACGVISPKIRIKPVLRKNPARIASQQQLLRIRTQQQPGLRRAHRAHRAHVRMPCAPDRPPVKFAITMACSHTHAGNFKWALAQVVGMSRRGRTAQSARHCPWWHASLCWRIWGSPQFSSSTFWARKFTRLPQCASRAARVNSVRVVTYICMLVSPVRC